MESGKATDVTEAAAMEEMSTVEEDVVVIWIAPTSHGTVLIYERFIGISAGPIGTLFRDTVEHMLDVNAAVKRLGEVVVTKVHVGEATVAKDEISQKLILIGMTTVVENAVTEDAVHRMLIALEEDHIDS